MTSRFFNNNIVEGKGFFFFAIAVAVIMKAVYFANSSISFTEDSSIGFFWMPIQPLLQIPVVNLAFSTICIALIVFLINNINTTHVLIRRKTTLPCSIAILLFSCMPSQMAMSPSYIGAIVTLLIINILFKSYAVEEKSSNAFNANFLLVLGSLFSPVLLIYFPILWSCLITMRCFSIRVIFSFLLSVAILYFPIFSYFFILKNDVTDFYQPFLFITDLDWTHLPIFDYNLQDYIVLALVLILTIVILIDNSINSFKDKIRTRAYISALSQIFLFSLLCILLLNVSLYSHLILYIALTVGSLSIAHFFALSQNKLILFVFVFFFLVLLFKYTLAF